MHELALFLLALEENYHLKYLLKSSIYNLYCADVPIFYIF